MKDNRFFIYFLILALLGAFCLSGCAFRIPRNQMQKKQPVSLSMEEYPRSLLQEALEWNQAISTARGKGWLTINSQRLKARFRMIWAARNQSQSPGRTKPQARLTLLDAGLPIETILFNGEKNPLSSQKPPRKVRARASARNITNGNIRHFFPVDVPVQHIIRLLLGQLPISDFIRAKSTFHGGADSKMPVSIITENDTGYQQTITWNPQGLVARIGMETSSGNMIYTITFSRWKQIGQYRIPYRVTVGNPKGESMVLDITRITPDVPVTSSVFELPQ